LGLAQSYTDNPQINTMRHPLGEITTRTTEQLMLEPGAARLIVRNTDGSIDFTTATANPRGSRISVGVL
jgi:hypothetical protein